MQESSSTVTSIQKLIKQLQKDVLHQIQKVHSEPIGKIHQIMRENGLTPDLIELSFKTRKPRIKKEVLIEPKAAQKLTVAQKYDQIHINIRTHQRVGLFVCDY